jgi:YspA, cpYpsA-related SLOG family
MIVIVAGSRSIVEGKFVIEAIERYVEDRAIARLVCGCAPGPDRLACEWAWRNGVPIEFFPAWDWQELWARSVWAVDRGDTLAPCSYGRGRSNGSLRNAAMAARADAALLIWDGKSHGTQDMAKRMERAKKSFVLAKVGVDIKE